MAGRFLREPRLPDLCSPWHISNQDSQLAGHQLRAIWKTHPDPQDKTRETEAGLAVELGFSDLRKPPQKRTSPLAGRRGRSPRGADRVLGRLLPMLPSCWDLGRSGAEARGSGGGGGGGQGSREGPEVAWQPHVGGERRGEIQGWPLGLDLPAARQRAGSAVLRCPERKVGLRFRPRGLGTPVSRCLLAIPPRP